MNVLLISEDYVRTNSNLNDNVFGKWILPAIREAQEMGLMPIIGECLYKRICEMVDNGDIDKKVYAAYKDLLDEKIQPYLLYQTLTNIVPLLNGKMGNIGTVATNDEHIVTLSQGELDLTQNYYRERADFYAKRLQEWVKANDLAFPELNCGCGNMKPNLERSNNSVGMWLGGARGKKVRSNDCGCKTDAVRPDCPPCPDYDEGYQSGYTSGHTDGYGEGYDDGYDRGQEDCPVCPDCDEAYQSGYTSGHTDGYGEGYDDGYDKGETDGYGEGFESGYTSGHTDGVEVVTTDFLHIDITQNGNYYKVGAYGAYSSITVDVATGSSCDLGELSVQLDTTQDWESGVSFTPEEGDGWSAVTIQDTSYGQEKFTSGYTSGYTEGYDSGYTSGYSSGYTSGYTSGDTNGYNRGYSSGWSSGYSSGYTSGYTDGASQQGDLESITFDVTQDTETIYPHSGYIGMSSVVVNAGDFGDGRYAEGYEDGVESMNVQDVKYDTPTYTEGEPYTVTPDFEYDSMASVELDLSGVHDEAYDEGQAFGESLFTDGAIAITATTNGVYTADTQNYEVFSSVTVNVSGTPCNLEGKSVVLTAATQTVEPSSGYDGMSAITIDATDLLDGDDDIIEKEKYLTFEAIENGGIEFFATTSPASWNIDNPDFLTVEYSINGSAWTSITAIDELSHTGTTLPTWRPQITFNAGDTIRIRGNNSSYCGYYPNDVAMIHRFWVKYPCYLYGNTMSLIYGDNFADKVEFPSGSARNLEFLFNMFETSNAIYSHPTKNVVLPATAATISGYYGTFSDCRITRAPSLPARQLAEACYMGMFGGCTGITQAPKLPALIMARNCYRGMFAGCTSLAEAPLLPATTLANGCYGTMFDGCTSLTTAPVLLASSLPSGCYNYMFQNCSNLNYVKCLAAEPYANRSTNGWLNGVSPIGTFVKSGNATWSVDIPSGWTIYDNSANPYQEGYDSAIAEIASLSTGLTATTNGTYTADTANKVYFSSVTVNVSGSTGSSLTGNFVYYFTEDGTQATYNPDAFFDASGNLLTAMQDDYTDMGRIIFDGNIHHIGADDGEGGYDFAFPMSDETGIGKITHLILPDTVVSISGLTNEDGPKIGFPANLEEIGGWFLKDSSIDTVYMPDTVTAVTGGYNFELPSLSNVHVSESLETLGDHAFYMAQNLSGIELPETLTSIGDRAFEGCQSLSEIYCYATTAPTLGNYVFGEDETTLGDAEGNEISSRVSEEGMLHVPSGSDYSSWMAQLPENWLLDDSL